MTRSTYSFAVRNAVDKLKYAANFIIRSNEEDVLSTQLLIYYPYRKNHNKCIQMNNEPFKEGMGEHHAVHYKKTMILVFYFQIEKSERLF